MLAARWTGVAACAARAADRGRILPTPTARATREPCPPALPLLYVDALSGALPCRYWHRVSLRFFSLRNRLSLALWLRLSRVRAAGRLEAGRFPDPKGAH
eukprot:COSAG04_NODE_24319_length_323_cov_1.156250_1_plen_99_part_10